MDKTKKVVRLITLLITITIIILFVYTAVNYNTLKQGLSGQIEKYTYYTRVSKNPL